MSWNLGKSWEQGLRIQVGSPMTTGPYLRLCGAEAIANGLSDRPKLADYEEVEIVGRNKGDPSTYIRASTLIDWPQLFIGYQRDGTPILIGIRQATQGNMSLCGQPRSGKSVSGALILKQIIRHGFAAFTLGLKSFDRTVYASMRSGAENETRLDQHGRPVAAPFRFVTLEPGLRTSGVNYFNQGKRQNLPKWLRAAHMVQALGQGGSADDPTRRFFAAASQEFLQELPWGNSFKELSASARKVRANRDVLYATAGTRHEMAKQAALEQQNLPADHPSHVDLTWLIRERGAMYFEACGQEIGDMATASAGLMALAILSAKREVDPTPNTLIFMVIDEAQIFPRALLRQLVEQCAGSGIRLIFIHHTLEQLGDDWETISMTQVRLFFGAVPGGLTERHIQALFGTKKTYGMNFGQNESDGISGSSMTSSGPQGTTTSVGNGWNKSNGSSFGLNEKEEPVWTNNDTLQLNYDPSAFVLIVAPGAELAFFGPTAIRGIAPGPPMPFSEINELSKKVHEQSEYTFLPATEQTPQLLAPATVAITNSARREALKQTLRHAVLRVRQTL